jgi:hypothetical protein
MTFKATEIPVIVGWMMLVVNSFLNGKKSSLFLNTSCSVASEQVFWELCTDNEH